MAAANVRNRTNVLQPEEERGWETARASQGGGTVVNGTGVCVWCKEEYKWTDYTSV